MAAMKVEKFNALVTYDRALSSQQNLQAAGVGVIVVVIHPKQFQRLRELAPDIQRTLDFLQPGQVVFIPASAPKPR